MHTAMTMKPNADPKSLDPAGLRIPTDILDALTEAQRQRLIEAITPRQTAHKFDFRTSLPFFGRRYYLTILAGPERRSLERLLSEGQLEQGKLLFVYGLRLCRAVARNRDFRGAADGIQSHRSR